jgi:hypothetical protein
VGENRPNQLVYEHLTATTDHARAGALRELVNLCRFSVKHAKLYFPGPNIDPGAGGYYGSPDERMRWFIEESVLRFLAPRRILTHARVEREAQAGKFGVVTENIVKAVKSEVRRLMSVREGRCLRIDRAETALDTDLRKASWDLLPGDKSFTRERAWEFCRPALIGRASFDPWFEKLLDLKMIAPIGRDQTPGQERYTKRALKFAPEVSSLDAPAFAGDEDEPDVTTQEAEVPSPEWRSDSAQRLGNRPSNAMQNRIDAKVWSYVTGLKGDPKAAPARLRAQVLALTDGRPLAALRSVLQRRPLPRWSRCLVCHPEYIIFFDAGKKDSLVKDPTPFEDWRKAFHKRYPLAKHPLTERPKDREEVYANPRLPAEPPASAPVDPCAGIHRHPGTFGLYLRRNGSCALLPECQECRQHEACTKKGAVSIRESPYHSENKAKKVS